MSLVSGSGIPIPNGGQHHEKKWLVVQFVTVSIIVYHVVIPSFLNSPIDVYRYRCSFIDQSINGTPGLRFKAIDSPVKV
jgi:hypothetical protein